MFDEECLISCISFALETKPTTFCHFSSIQDLKLQELNSNPPISYPWLRDLASLRLNFFTYKMGLVIVPNLLGCWDLNEITYT